MPTIKMLLKFGNKSDIEDLFLNGTIYMNPIQKFKDIEDGGLRGDKYEGISGIRNYLPGSFEIPSIGYKGHHLGIHIRESYEKTLGNIYSLYCISPHGWKNPLDFKIDSRMSEFGSHCLLIKDNLKFYNSINVELYKMGIEYFHRHVNYYDKNKVNTSISVFEKPLEFEFQKEYRWYIRRPSIEPLSFSIGSLVSISELHTSDSIVEELKLRKAI
jgi:hypothetical protein